MMKKGMVLAVCMLLMGCGTLFTSKEQKMSFDSNEKNVEIFVNGEKRCTTPCITGVSRSRDSLLIVAKKNGFEDKTTTLPPGINIISLFNIFSVTGFTTDVSTGYMWEYQPNAFYIVMEREAATPEERAQRAKENQIRKFILANYSEISAEAVHRAVKDYLTTLSDMTGLSVGKLKDVLSRSQDETTFANDVVHAYRKKQL